MASDRQQGCLWCEIRYLLSVALRVPFHFCERCQARMRLTQSAWKSWSQTTTGSPPG